MSSGALSTRNVTVSEPGEGLIDVVDVDEHLKARVRTDLYADQRRRRPSRPSRADTTLR